MKKILLLLAIPILMGAGCSSDIKDKSQEPSPLLNQEVQNENSLDLSGQGLKKAEQSIFKQTNLTSLNLSNNNLTGALPAEIRQLTKLQYLDASSNKMTGVPAEIGQLSNLKNLKTLNLSGNEISQQDLDGIRQNLPADVIIIE